MLKDIPLGRTGDPEHDIGRVVASLIFRVQEVQVMFDPDEGLKIRVSFANFIEVRETRNASARQVQQFGQAIVSGEPLLVTAEEGRAAVEMVEAAIRSARTGEAVPIPVPR